MLYKVTNFINNLAVIKKQSFSLKERLRLYYLVSKLTENGLTFSTTILELQKAELVNLDVVNAYKTPMYFILKDIYQKQQTGADIAQGLSAYVPDADRMMIAAFEEANISLGFANLIKYNNSLQEMQAAY